MTYESADEFGDNVYVELRTGFGADERIKVWNFSGRSLRVSTNSGTEFINIRSAITRPKVFEGSVRYKHVLDSFEGGASDGDWAIVSPAVAAKLRRKAWKWRILVANDDPYGLPRRMDGSNVGELDSLMFRLWPAPDGAVSSALNELDFASTDTSITI